MSSTNDFYCDEALSGRTPVRIVRETGDVLAFIVGTGRPLPAHGPGDMPVWGPIFRALETSDPRVKVRIENIVAYIESIQVR